MAKDKDPSRLVEEKPWMTPERQAIIDKGIQEICRIYTERVVKFLVRTMEDESRPIQWRLQAARELAGYGYGKPAQTVDATLSKGSGWDVINYGFPAARIGRQTLDYDEEGPRSAR